MCLCSVCLFVNAGAKEALEQSANEFLLWRCVQAQFVCPCPILVVGVRKAFVLSVMQNVKSSGRRKVKEVKRNKDIKSRVVSSTYRWS